MNAALQKWLQYAPAPVGLPEGQRYHVFISYRSANRQWVLQLYDILRHLNYQVFVDRFVLPPGDQLPASLSAGIAQSRAAILMWSKAFPTSKWCDDELNAIHARRNEDSTFRYVIATLDDTPLPVLYRPAIRVDFATSMEGPSGSGILELITGLAQQPLPPDAVQLAAQVDEQFRSGRSRIRAARAAGDVGELVRLSALDELAWLASPALDCEIADALIALGKYTEALGVLGALDRNFPRSLRAKQLKGLALARSGDWKQAMLELGELYEAGHIGPETLGIYARTWMDRYKASGNVLHLRKSRDLYREAFEAFPDDYYTGINAASKSLLAGDRALAQELAGKLQALVGTQAIRADYWKTATAAEVQLLLEHFDAAGALYGQAVAGAPEELGSHESTRDQAALLLDALRASEADRAKVLGAFAHLPPR